MVADSDMQFVRSARKLTHVQEEAIYELSNMNLGPVKAFNLMRTQYGGFEKVGATKDDCKNFRQGLNCYIGEYDAEMIVQRLCAKKTFSSDYSFEYDVNDDRELIRMFWADETSKTPKVVVTDQDPAMKQAIAAVFPNTRHRLCMWHIMKKVADKVGDNLCNNEDFKSRLCNIVWADSISPLEFEEKWQAIMVEFELDKNKWLTDMYEIRFDWIPAFYRDELLSGLMRTTSRSESENHVFGKATNSQLTLVEFFNHFDFCMEIQRYNGRRCDHDSRYTYPHSFEEEGGFLRCKIMDFNAYVPGFLEVVFKKDDEFGEESIATCSCKRFEQYGLLCRHIFYVMNMYQVKKFPKRYINDRWRKEAAVNIRTVPMSEFGNDQNMKIKEISREIKYAGGYLINSYVADIDELIKVRDEMNLMIEKADLTRYEKVRPSKRDRFAAVLGFEQPSEVTVRVPTGIRNKGRGSHKIIKSKKEIAISRSGKGYRECQICHKTGHNSRTCKAMQQQPQQ
ncbi:protein FAR1-RELATED SEQUENCE 5-like [Bidens hawaiensis]|uniref:protein FAR1-RELATED SEQUENCE 5-like n=1 Tax=Bidens hawaiensis TaxID=980011 RepID=UPI0040491EEE